MVRNPETLQARVKSSIERPLPDSQVFLGKLLNDSLRLTFGDDAGIGTLLEDLSQQLGKHEKRFPVAKGLAVQFLGVNLDMARLMGVAPIYDLSPNSPGNGVWSFTKSYFRFMKAFLEDLKSPKHLISMYTTVESTLVTLKSILDRFQLLSSLAKQIVLSNPDEWSNATCSLPLKQDVLDVANMDMSVFYGSYFGSHYTTRVRIMFDFHTSANAAFGQAFHSSEHKVVRDALGAMSIGAHMIDKEKRGIELYEMLKNANVDLAKYYWNKLDDLHQHTSKFVGIQSAVNQLIKLMPKPLKFKGSVKVLPPKNVDFILVRVISHTPLNHCKIAQVLPRTLLGIPLHEVFLDADHFNQYPDSDETAKASVKPSTQPSSHSQGVIEGGKVSKVASTRDAGKVLKDSSGGTGDASSTKEASSNVSKGGASIASNDASKEKETSSSVSKEVTMSSSVSNETFVECSGSHETPGSNEVSKQAATNDKSSLANKKKVNEMTTKSNATVPQSVTASHSTATTQQKVASRNEAGSEMHTTDVTCKLTQNEIAVLQSSDTESHTVDVSQNKQHNNSEQLQSHNKPDTCTTSEEYVSEECESLEQSLREAQSKTKAKFDGIVVHIHGGGFIAHSSNAHQGYLKQWAKNLHVTIVSIDYTLAPQGRFPRAFEECFYVYCWVKQNCHLFGCSPGAPVFVSGDSAGGNLALAISLQAQYLGVPPPAGVHLNYPATNLKMALSPARLLAAFDGLLNIHILLLCLAQYAELGSDVHDIDHANPLASPWHASDEDLAKLPPVALTVCEFDPLLDDGIDLARRMQALRRAGARKNRLYCRLLNNCPHGFLNLLGCGDPAIEEAGKVCEDYLRMLMDATTHEEL